MKFDLLSVFFSSFDFTRIDDFAFNLPREKSFLIKRLFPEKHVRNRMIN